MLTAIQNIIVAIVAILFCWIPAITGLWYSAKGFGPITYCIREEWAIWWEMYLKVRA